MQLPDAEALCNDLAEAMRPHVSDGTALVGIHTGGVWLAERLHGVLGLQQPLGSIDVSFYRYESLGMAPAGYRVYELGLRSRHLDRDASS
jgi:pyrimidine operon attenuation protein/uracil phosphoribosyltransferase